MKIIKIMPPPPLNGNKTHCKCGDYESSWNRFQELHPQFKSVATPVTKLL